LYSCYFIQLEEVGDHTSLNILKNILIEDMPANKDINNLNDLKLKPIILSSQMKKLWAKGIFKTQSIM